MEFFKARKDRKIMLFKKLCERLKNQQKCQKSTFRTNLKIKIRFETLFAKLELNLILHRLNDKITRRSSYTRVN